MNEINHKIFPWIFFSLFHLIHIFHNLDGRSVRAFPIICLCSANKIYWLPFIALFTFLQKQGNKFYAAVCSVLVTSSKARMNEHEHYINIVALQFARLVVILTPSETFSIWIIINWIVTTKHQSPVNWWSNKIRIQMKNEIDFDLIGSQRWKIVIENPIPVCRWKYVCSDIFQFNVAMTYSVGRKPLENRFERAYPILRSNRCLKWIGKNFRRKSQRANPFVIFQIQNE